MPTVPMLPGAQVAPEALPGVRVSPDAPAAAFGVPGNGPDLSGVARQVGAMYARARQQADQTAVLDADNNLAAVRTQLLRDPQTGVLNAQGKNAMDAAAKVPDAWQKAVGDIEGGLANDTQRLAFRARAAAQWNELSDTMEAHVGQQARVYQQQVTQGALASRYTDAVQAAAAGDLGTVKTKLAETTAIVQDHGQAMGLPPEAITASQQRAASQLHLGVLAQLADRHDGSAQQYFATNKGAFDGDDLPKAEAIVKDGSTKEAALQQSDAILAKFDPTQGASLNDALGAARQIADPDVRETASALIRQRFSDNEASQRDQQQQTMLTATNILERTHGDFSAIPSATITSLSLQDRDALRRYGQVLQKGLPVETNQQVWYTLMKQANSDDPKQRAAFANLNLMQYKPDLSDSDFQQVAGVQMALKKGENKSNDALNSFGAMDGVIERSLSAAGINPHPKPTDKNGWAQVGEFWQAVQTRAVEQQQATGKKIDTQGLQEIVDDLLVQQKVQGTGFFSRLLGLGTNRRGFELTIDDVPAADRQAITAQLKARGRPVSDQLVLDTYRHGLAGQQRTPRLP